MMGLVIIVILIIFAALLFVRFGLTKPPNEQSSIQTAQSYNLINAITNIQICDNQSIRQAIHKCNTNEPLCNQEACSYTTQRINQIIQASTSKSMAFYAYNEQTELLNTGDCTYGTASPPYFFKEENQEYETFIKVCK